MKSGRKRIWLTASCIVLASVALVYQLSSLQLTQHEHYSALSKGNHIRLLPVAPARGAIYDRNGHPLAFNRTAYYIEVNPSLAGSPEEIVKNIQAVVAVNTHDIAKLRREWNRPRQLNTLRLSAKLGASEVARLAVRLHAMRGVAIVGALDRHYPYGEQFAHALGYLGDISEKDLERFGPDYRHRHAVGKVGAEFLYERRLKGALGVRRAEINAQGRIIRSHGTQAPQPGADLMLALDADLQRAAHEAIGDSIGAIVALDPRSGEVLALASKPAYDPNRFVGGISAGEYRALVQRIDRPLFNRATQGQYAPGSTVKPIVALAGLEHRLITPDYHIFAGPHYTAPGHTRKFRDWRKEGHGWVNVRSSIAQSCDVFFYDLAYRTGIERLGAMMTRFGLGAKTGIDLDNEAGGLVPTRAWKKRRFNLPWYPEETVNTGVGQGYMLTTPLQLAAAVAAIANRGERVIPRIVRAIRGSDGNWRYTQRRTDEAVVLRNKNNWDIVIDSMVDTVHRPNGTAFSYIGRNLPYTMAGKTGTAQNYNLGADEEYDADTLSPHLRDHALFIGFAPVENPRIAVAAVAENGGSGAKVAAPMVRAVMDAFFREKVAALDRGATGP